MQVSGAAEDNRVHGRRGRDSEGYAEEGAEHVQCEAPGARHHVRILAQEEVGGGRTVSLLHDARTEFGLDCVGTGGGAQVSTRRVHRHDGLRLHVPHIQVLGGRRDRRLRPLSDHQHGHVAQSAKPRQGAQQQPAGGQQSLSHVHEALLLSSVRLGK